MYLSVAPVIFSAKVHNVSIEKLKVESRQELEQMITNEIDQIEKGLTVICSNIPINDKAILDVLCHDNNGQLVIMQLNTNEDDIMLVHGIQSLDYVAKFKNFLKATYNKHKIDDKTEPRLILIAPSFSDALRHAVEGIKGMRIDLYEWEYLKLGDHKGLRLQPIFTWKTPESPREEKIPEKKREPKPTKKKEPELSTTEKQEELEPEFSKEPESPKEEFKFPPPPEEKQEEPKEEETIAPHKEEPPKRKLKLF
jgi:hypothetical protein